MRKRISQWLAQQPLEPGGRDKFTDRLHNDTVIDAPSAVSNFKYLLGALRSRAPGQYSGNVLELSRHLTSSIFLAINTQQKQAASAEWKIMEKTYDTQEGDLELPHTDPACQLFQDPNNEDDWADVCEGLVQQLGLTGIGLTWLPQFEEGEVPSEMYVIPTASALPWPPSPVYPHGSYLIQPYYPYGPFSTIPSYQSAAGARIPAEQIMRCKNLHPILRYDGYAVLTAIQRIVDTVEAIDLARWSTQEKGIDPTVGMTFDPQLLNPNTVDLARLRTQLEAVAAGPSNAGKILFNPLGGTISKLSNTPSEMAWTEGWDQLVSFSLACFGTPKSVAGLNDDTSYANLYASLKQFYILSLCPLLNKLGRRFTKMLLRPYFGNDLYLKLTPERIDDRELQEKQLSTDLQAGIRTMNEWRKMRELPPFDGEKGEAMVGGQQAQQEQGAKENEARESGRMEEREITASRPKNQMGTGSLGPRKSMTGDALAVVLERAKSNGHAKDLGKDDDGAEEFWSAVNRRN